MSTTGRLFVISAPSGAGKTTLVHRIMAADPSLCFSISYTTRDRRHNEKEGESYHFVSKEQFEKMIAAGEFLEHAEVFDNYYGTPKQGVQDLLKQGRNVILEIDWQGAQQVRKNMPDCLSVFILPPSVKELEQRLRGRATDSDEVIARRLADSVADISHWQEFDYAVINDDLDTATATLQSILGGDNEANLTTSPEIKAALEQILS